MRILLNNNLFYITKGREGKRRKQKERERTKKIKNILLQILLININNICNKKMLVFVFNIF